MQRINIYIPEELNERLDFTAKSYHKTKAEIIRDSIEKGINLTYPRSSAAKALLKLAKLAKKEPTRGYIPNDFIDNLDYYTWGGKKRE